MQAVTKTKTLRNVCIEFASGTIPVEARRRWGAQELKIRQPVRGLHRVYYQEQVTTTQHLPTLKKHATSRFTRFDH